MEKTEVSLKIQLFCQHCLGVDMFEA